MIDQLPSQGSGLGCVAHVLKRGRTMQNIPAGSFNQMTVSDVLGSLCPESVSNFQYVTAITADSRHIIPGSIFVAYPGTQSDGRAFVAEAIARGAIAVVYDSDAPLSPVIQEAIAAAQRQSCLMIPIGNCRSMLGEMIARFYGDPSAQMSVTAITGTNGKTSCAHLMTQALQGAGHSTGVIGTIGWGQPGRLNSTQLTTPDASTLQAQCAVFRDQGVQSLVLEASSHALAQSRLSGLSVDTAVFTNLTRDHLDYHATFEQYGQAKLQLFLRPELQQAVINLDDPFSNKILAALPDHVHVVGVSQNKMVSEVSACTVDTVEVTAQGLHLTLYTPWGLAQIRSALKGRFQMSNILLTLPMLVFSGLSLNQACQAIESVQQIPGRMQYFGGDGRPTVVVDYAHTPDALKVLLTHVREFCSGRLYLVFGCGGERDKGKRKLMGEIAERFSDEMILTNDNPRDESPEAIVQDICSGLLCPWGVTVEYDRCMAIQSAIAQARAEDVVVVAGKGHEQIQVIAGQYHSHSDLDYVEDRLNVWPTVISDVA